MKKLDNLVTDLVQGHDGVWREPQVNFSENMRKMSESHKSSNPIVEKTQSFEELLESFKTNPIEIDEDYFKKSKRHAEDMICYSLGLSRETINVL